jgi:hypothetical protein
MLCHVQCLDCGARFNGRSGRSNLPGIMVYNGVKWPLFALLAWMVWQWLRG